MRELEAHLLDLKARLLVVRFGGLGLWNRDGGIGHVYVRHGQSVCRSRAVRGVVGRFAVVEVFERL